MIHPVDRAAGLALANGPLRNKLFAHGWGDAATFALESATNLGAAPIAITWQTSTTLSNGNTVEHAAFVSPIERLPIRGRLGSFTSVTPAEPTRRLVLLMAAWNEHDPRIRMVMADLLAERGIRSIVPENPFYGTRRHLPGHRQAIQTVSDFMLMGESAVAEARSILLSFRADGWDIGVAGYSMGGNTAAVVSAIMQEPVATAALAASHSPGPVFLDGVLRKGIAWEKLGGTKMEPVLREIFDSVSVLRLPPAPHCRHAVIVRVSNDGYIPATAVEELASHWRGSELRVVKGGHATAIWFHKNELVDAIVDSFNRLERH